MNVKQEEDWSRSQIQSSFELLLFLDSLFPSAQSFPDTPSATFILFTSTNVAIPAAMWTPILTNQFDSFGVFSYTNLFNSRRAQGFFLLQRSRRESHLGCFPAPSAGFPYFSPVHLQR